MKGRGGILIGGVFAPVVVGFAGYMNLMSRPRFAAFHSVDVLQLLAIGACFGIALAALIIIIRSPRTQ